MAFAAKLDEFGKPAWIALTVLGFAVWWPLGLATLAFAIGSGRMMCGMRGRLGRWYNTDGDWGHGGGRHRRWGARAHTNGNRAFDDYRDETLRRLEEEEREFASSSTACAWPRTRPSSTSSWPSADGAEGPPRRLPRADPLVMAAHALWRAWRRRSGSQCHALSSITPSPFTKPLARAARRRKVLK